MTTSNCPQTRSKSCFPFQRYYFGENPIKANNPALLKVSPDFLKDLREKISVFNEHLKNQKRREKELAEYKGLLRLNGHDLVFQPGTKRFPLPLSLSSGTESIQERTESVQEKKSCLSKFSPNIDMLRLNPKKAKINHRLDEIDPIHFRFYRQFEADHLLMDSLIDHRWIQNCDNFTDFSKLHIAVFKKDRKTIKKILSPSSQKKSINDLIQKKDANNLTALHWAVILGDKGTLITLLNCIKSEDRLSALNMQDDRGWSVFKWAIAKEDEDLIKNILSLLNDIDKSMLITGLDRFKRSYVHYAIETCNKGIIKLFLDQILFDKDRDILTTCEDFLGQTILHLAINFLDAETFEELLCGLIPNECYRSEALQKLDNQNQSLLHKAVVRSDVDILKVIMKNIISKDKQRYLQIQDDQGKTALHLSVMHGIQQKCFEFLLNEIDQKNMMAYLFMKDKEGKSALHYLANDVGTYAKLLALFERLKSYSKNNVMYKQNVMKVLLDVDNFYRSILHYIILIGDCESLNVILSQFDNDDEKNKLSLLRQKDIFGKTPLHYLFEMTSNVLSKIDLEYWNIFESFLTFIPETHLAYFLNIKDMFSKSPFFYAIAMFQENVRAIEGLLEKIPHRERKDLLKSTFDEKNNTVLHYLAQDNKQNLLITILRCIDNVRDRKELLELKNENGKRIKDLIECYAYFERLLESSYF